MKFPSLCAAAFVTTLCVSPANSSVLLDDLRACNVRWDSPSRDSFDSMPLSGSLGAAANVWVQDGSLWIYLAHNGAYDESGRLLKLGCLRLTPVDLDWKQPAGFQQELDLSSGAIRISGKAKDDTQLSLRLRFAGETLLIDSDATRPLAWQVSYGTWRDAAKSAKLDLFDGPETVAGDAIAPVGDALHFVHRNGASTREDKLASGQTLTPDAMLHLLPERNSGGVLVAQGGLTFAPAEPVEWQTWKGKAWPARTVVATKHALSVALGAAKNADPKQWEAKARALLSNEARAEAQGAADKRWAEFWNRSAVFVAPGGEASDPAFQVGRNYQLFRYMLACNQGGELPLKFNGGVFTADTHPDRVPKHLNNPGIAVAPGGGTTPDFRRWGQMFMAQNQRWLGWPTLAAGDADLLAPSVAFYRDRLAIARQRAKNLKAEGACYSEAIGLEGTTCVAATKEGLTGATHLLYHFSTSLEMAWMALQGRDVLGTDLKADLPWMMEVVRFFDSFYRMKTKTRTGAELGVDGKWVIYPANSMELLSGATNPIEVVAGLHRVTEGLLSLPGLPAADREFLTRVRKELPELPTATRADKKVLSPAAKWEGVHNPWELPELFAAWPYRLVGVTRPDTLTLARDTWDTLTLRGDNQSQLFCKLDFSWQPTWVDMAALALPEEAQKRAIAKFSDKASACRFPAFFGPGHDWMPDHNWGGSGMVGLQEMLVASDPGSKGTIHLLPAWPKTWNVRFRLHTAGKTTVSGEVRDGKLVHVTVNPPSSAKDLVLPQGWEMP